MASAFGKRLKEVFNSAESKIIAGKLGVTPAAVSNYMSGRIPDGDKLKLITELTNCNLHWLLTGEGSKYVSSNNQEKNLPNTEESKMSESEKLEIEEFLETYEPSDDHLVVSDEEGFFVNSLKDVVLEIMRKNVPSIVRNEIALANGEGLSRSSKTTKNVKAEETGIGYSTDVSIGSTKIQPSVVFHQFGKSVKEQLQEIAERIRTAHQDVRRVPNQFILVELEKFQEGKFSDVRTFKEVFAIGSSNTKISIEYLATGNENQNSSEEFSIYKFYEELKEAKKKEEQQQQEKDIAENNLRNTQIVLDKLINHLKQAGIIPDIGIDEPIKVAKSSANKMLTGEAELEHQDNKRKVS